MKSKSPAMCHEMSEETSKYLGHYKKAENMNRGHNTNWIAGAITHPGALHRQLGVPAGKTIPAAKLAKAVKAGGKLGRRARLAQTLKGMH